MGPQRVLVTWSLEIHNEVVMDAWSNLNLISNFFKLVSLSLFDIVF